MPITPTTTSDITPLIAGYVRRTPLDVALPEILHLAFAMRETVPRGAGTRWTGRRPTKLTKQTAQLTEGTTPSNNALAVTDVAINLKPYGNFFTFTDVAEETEPVDLANMFGPLLQVNAAESLDAIVKAAVLGGSNVYYANSVAARANVAQNLVANDLDRVIKYLQGQSARYVQRLIAPNGNVSTTPIPNSYVMLCHTDVANDIETTVSGFVPVHKYPNPALAVEGERGAYRQIRVIASPLCDDGTAQVGAAGTTVYKNDATNFYVYLCAIFGANAYGAARISDIIPTKAGGNDQADSSDPLGQRESHGWKIKNFGAAIVNGSWLVRLETAAKL